MIALPVAVASWLSAHCLAYVFVPPTGSGTMHPHMDESHNWFASMPVLVAAGVTVLAAGLVLCVGEGLRAGPERSAGLTPVFALLPPLGFVVQEHLEHLLTSGSATYEVALEPTFLTGLALQLPFALGALLLTGALVSLGYRFGRLLGRVLPAARPPDGRPVPAIGLGGHAHVVVSSPLVPAHAPRAPPCVAPS